MRNKAEKYVIGVDGGGTKTVAVLANLKKILRISKTGSSNLRNIGLKETVSNISKAISKVIRGFKRNEILSIVIGLPAIEEEFKFEKERLKREIAKKTKFKTKKIEIVSDQIVGFKSGTEEKNGLVLISGTGCVCHGWKEKKEAKCGGWGWLNDEGSGFWIGQKGYQAVLKELDGRDKKTKITKFLFKEWKLKNKEDLMKKVYGKDLIKTVSLISKTVDKSAKAGDEIAQKIMEEAGKELAYSAISVIKNLNFEDQKFPLVLIGAVFKSKIVLKEVKRRVKKIAPKAKFILPKLPAVIGAVKLAREKIK